MRLPTSWGLATLQMIRALMPYWIVIPPLILLTLLVRQIWNWRRQVNWNSPLIRVWTWVPGISHTLFLQRCAYFAQSLATLLNEGTPIAESLRLAGGTCGDANLDSASKSLALAIQKGQFPDDDTLTALRFPSFLRWAIWHSNEISDRANGLRLVAGLYQRTAAYRNQQLRTVTPVIVFAIIGGGVTLLYALALFVPVYQMLHALAH
jgi:type II secretory pathway component PulF